MLGSRQLVAALRCVGDAVPQRQQQRQRQQQQCYQHELVAPRSGEYLFEARQRKTCPNIKHQYQNHKGNDYTWCLLTKYYITLGNKQAVEKAQCPIKFDTNII